MRPPGRREFPVFRPIGTRWMDNDVYAHVNNVVYYSFFDTAVNGWLLEQGLLDPVNGSQVGLVVETRCQYFSSLSFPDDVTVGLRAARIGRSSVRYALGVFRNQDELASAAGEFVHVYVDRVSRRPSELQPNLRQALETIAENSESQRREPRQND